MESISKVFIFGYAFLKALGSEFFATILHVLSGSWLVTWFSDFFQFIQLPIELLLVPPLVIGSLYFIRICTRLYTLKDL